MSPRQGLWHYGYLLDVIIQANDHFHLLILERKLNDLTNHIFENVLLFKWPWSNNQTHINKYTSYTSSYFPFQ